MASINPVFSVKLTSADVPGAKFTHTEVSQHSVFEIKRWLECRGLPTSGNKEELSRRCLSCIEAGKAEDILISIDGGKWYSKKVQQVLGKVKSDTRPSSVPVLPIIGWKPFPTASIPKGFTYGTIHDHIITSAKLCGLDGEPDVTTDFSTTKPMMKGRQFFLSGHVQDIEDCVSPGYYFLKCKVMASYKIHILYNVSVTLNIDESSVTDASCDCKASAMGRCNHVAALLFALEDYTMQFGYEAPACTSKLCGWNVGKKRHKNPMPAHEQQYNKKTAPDRIITFDPRKENSRTTQAEEDFQHRFISSLHEVSSNVFHHLLEINYEDYEVETESLSKIVSSAYEQFKSCFEHYNGPFEVADTKGQSDSAVWSRTRSFRVTASIAKDVVGLSSARAKFTFLRRHLWGKDNIMSKGMIYGKNCEDLAFKQYTEQNMPSERDSEISKSGFWVNPKFPELGCSPDGLIFEGSVMKGVLEIKCPSTLENLSPFDSEQLSKKQLRNQCFTLDNGLLRLKRTHKYFYQIQMQMAVCEVEFCDFVIYSPKGMSVERIFFDKTFWMGLLPKLQEFHKNVLLPEYIEMRIPRRLLPITM